MKTNHVLLLATVACVASLSRAPTIIAAERPAVGGISVERLQRLDALLEREIAAGRLSGMVVAVARHREVLQRNKG